MVIKIREFPMNLAVGILMFVLGIITLVAWFSELIPYFKGVLVCALLLSGIVGILVGVAKLRAQQTLAKAARDKPSSAEKSPAETNA